MVKKGHFTVELVDALTKIPFKEHTAPDGETYVEVEPEAEYFIRVHSKSNHHALLDLSVDGEGLGYEVVLPIYDSDDDEDSSEECGVWSQSGNICSDKSLKFAKTQVQQRTRDSSSTPHLWTGQIEVEIHEARVLKNLKNDHNVSEHFKEGDVGYVVGVSDPRKIKGIRTTKGTTTESSEINLALKKLYEKVSLLGTIKLNYCTTPGLIIAGILPKLHAWEYARMTKPFKRKASEGGKEFDILPKRVQLECEDGLVNTKEFEYFDLSQLSSPEDEDEDISEDRDISENEDISEDEGRSEGEGSSECEDSSNVY